MFFCDGEVFGAIYNEKLENWTGFAKAPILCYAFKKQLFKSYDFARCDLQTKKTQSFSLRLEFPKKYPFGTVHITATY